MIRLHNKGLLAAVAASLASSTATAQPAPEPTEHVYLYYADELQTASWLPAGLKTLRAQDAALRPCALNTGPRLAPVLIPLALFGFKLFASVIEDELSRREKQRLEALSHSFVQLRNDEIFPLSATGRDKRCLVVDRVLQIGDQIHSSGAIYVFGMRRVGSTAFTVEPVAARVDASKVLRGQREAKLNSTVSISIQSVVTEDGKNELLVLPVYSATFSKLEQGSVKISPPSERRSPVMPLPAGRSVPVSIGVAVTESHVSLTRETERVALEKANRTALIAAVGEAIKVALED